jgi:Na+/H+ antiporter NhaD/arsenite permease-like protein
MTPIGNPQNFLIAVESGMRAPMLEFLRYLALPTLANYNLLHTIVMMIILLILMLILIRIRLIIDYQG